MHRGQRCILARQAQQNHCFSDQPRSYPSCPASTHTGHTTAFPPRWGPRVGGGVIFCALAVPLVASGRASATLHLGKATRQPARQMCALWPSCRLIMRKSCRCAGLASGRPQVETSVAVPKNRQSTTPLKPPPANLGNEIIKLPLQSPPHSGIVRCRQYSTI